MTTKASEYNTVRRAAARAAKLKPQEPLGFTGAFMISVVLAVYAGQVGLSVYYKKQGLADDYYLGPWYPAAVLVLFVYGWKLAKALAGLDKRGEAAKARRPLQGLRPAFKRLAESRNTKGGLAAALGVSVVLIFILGLNVDLVVFVSCGLLIFWFIAITFGSAFFRRRPKNLPYYENPLEPMWVDGEYASPDYAAWQAARPEAWRELWPDDPALVAVRDRLSPVVARVCGFEKTSFLPEDEIEAIFNNGGHKIDGYDQIEALMEIEESFGIALDDGFINGTATYLDLVKLVLEQVGPDAPAKLDAAPLTVPPDFFESRFGLLIGTSFTVRQLRRQQSVRSSSALDLWPEDAELKNLRDEVGQVLIKKPGWPTDLFIPQDNLAALFLGLRGKASVISTVRLINKKFNLSLDPQEVMAGRLAFIDLLNLIKGK